MCPCVLTGQFLARIGAGLTARLHARPRDAWTGAEELAHIDEEDQHLAPLIAIFDPSFYRDYVQDHRLFRWEIRTYGRVTSRERFEAHARREDAFVLRFMRAHGEQVPQ